MHNYWWILANLITNYVGIISTGLSRNDWAVHVTIFHTFNGAHFHISKKHKEWHTDLNFSVIIKE